MVHWVHVSRLSNGIAICSAVLPQLTRVTNTDTHTYTDTQTTLCAISVAIGQISCCLQAMRPKYS